MSEIHADTLWTIGHSVRPWEAFVGMLAAARISRLVDVRRFAGSRRNPQFSGEAMATALATAGIEYVPMPDLGGRRHARDDSHNLAWRSAGFRGYADYMGTSPYREARARLGMLAQRDRTAMMCAEAMWWQCHRSLISDDFKTGGWAVIHLLSPGREEAHPYTSAARVLDGRLDYTLPACLEPAHIQQDDLQQSLF
ncbi:MAG TPA: DUF488 domain-containing protein [Pseudoxanthomonas sp.]|nr:DUF488 domain-containing protein [Pseudoxanthomonas sp.]